MLAEGTANRMSSVARITIEPAGQAEPKKPKRGQYSLAGKQQMVEESFQPQTSVARVAREHGINANQLFAWRRLYRRGQLGTPTRSAPAAPLLPVRISDSEAAPNCLPTSSPIPAGTIQ